VLRTRSPVVLADPHDLHVLSTPPAFVLSQDQTLQEFDIARSSNRCHHAVALDSVSESLNCSGQALPDVPNRRQFNELTSHIQIPNSIVKKQFVALGDSLQLYPLLPESSTPLGKLYQQRSADEPGAPPLQTAQTTLAKSTTWLRITQTTLREGIEE
jgi:hypothetical protein